MNIQTALGESRAMGSRPLTVWDTLMDTIAMINTPSITKTGRRAYDMYEILSSSSCPGLLGGTEFCGSRMARA